ncbi:MAG: lipocalin family protein [Mycobacterium sp.]
MRALVWGLSFAACIASAAEPLATVGTVDLTRYAGQWFEIAKYPNRFQRQCIADTTATYRLLDDGNVGVLNSCRTAQGMDEADGIARPLKGRTDRLEVSFLPAALRWLPVGWGNYWIIELAPDYRYAVVGEPSRDYLWVLARTRTLSAEDRRAIEARLPAHGYDHKRLVDSPQEKN